MLGLTAIIRHIGIINIILGIADKYWANETTCNNLNALKRSELAWEAKTSPRWLVRIAISLDTQRSDLGLNFTGFAILVEKHQPPRCRFA